MGTINKYSNLYNKDNTVIKSVNENGILTDYSIKELEELVDTLEDSNEKNNAMSMLQKMYANPKTEADKKYVAELRNELLEKLKANTSTKKEEVTKALGEVDDELTNKVSNTLNEVIEEQKQEDPSFQVICHTPEAVEEFDKVVRDDIKEISNDDEYVEPISEEVA